MLYVLFCLASRFTAVTALMKITNIALFKPAYQSSTAGYGGGYMNHAGLAVDGIVTHPGKPLNGCASTFDDRRPEEWWTVDLREIHVIFYISLYVMKTTFPVHISVHIGDNFTDLNWRRCLQEGNNDRGQIGVYNFTCARETTGQWLLVNQHFPRGNLQLCETKVFGYSYEGLKEHYVNPMNIEVEETSVRFQFRLFMDNVESDLLMNGNNVTQYTVEMRERSSSRWVVKSTIQQNEAGIIENVTLDGLQPNTSYTVRIVPWYMKNQEMLRKNMGNGTKFRTLRTNQFTETDAGLGPGGIAAAILGSFLLLIVIVGAVLFILYFRGLFQNKNRDVPYAERKGVPEQTNDDYVNVNATTDMPPVATREADCSTMIISEENYEDITVTLPNQLPPVAHPRNITNHEPVKKNQPNTPIFEDNTSV